MRARLPDNLQVPAAALFSVALITGAYMLARGFESPSLAQASTETEILKAIATKDSDTDGLPNWEESLYGTDPRITDTFKLGMTDGAAVAKGLIVPKAIADLPVAAPSQDGSSISDPSLPLAAGEGTLTAIFAENFFKLFIAAKQANNGNDLSESQMNDVANQTLNSIAAIIQAAPDFKSARDIAVFGSGADAMRAFAVSAEAVMQRNTTDATTTEINYLKNALIHNDDTAYAHIASIAKAYRNSAIGLSRLSVPKELAADNLLLINALMRMSRIVSDFTRADTDPLAAILALQQYAQAVQSLGTAFINIGGAYETVGVSLPYGTPGASFVNIIATIQKRQAAQP